MASGAKWTRGELLLAINLYCRTPFGRIHERNPEIVELAAVLGRSPGAVSWKLANFAHLDPSIDRDGAANVSRMDREVWAEVFADWDALTDESERLWRDMIGVRAQSDDLHERGREGREVERTVRARVNQDFFRRMILAAYDGRCCITGLSVPGLLVASHIVPWSVDAKARLNPRNGLCLNALHDKAFDLGLITLTDDCHVKVSPALRAREAEGPEQQLLIRYDKTGITLPKRFLPDPEFLSYHREVVFAGTQD